MVMGTKKTVASILNMVLAIIAILALITILEPFVFLWWKLTVYLFKLIM